MKSAAFREDHKVTFGHCIVLALTLKTQFTAEPMKNCTQLKEQKKVLFGQGVIESSI